MLLEKNKRSLSPQVSWQVSATFLEQTLLKTPLKERHQVTFYSPNDIYKVQHRGEPDTGKAAGVCVPVPLLTCFSPCQNDALSQMCSAPGRTCCHAHRYHAHSCANPLALFSHSSIGQDGARDHLSSSPSVLRAGIIQPWYPRLPSLGKSHPFMHASIHPSTHPPNHPAVLSVGDIKFPGCTVVPGESCVLRA